MKQYIMNIFWHIPFLSDKLKETIYYFMRRIILKEKNHAIYTEKHLSDYISQVLLIANAGKNNEVEAITKNRFEYKATDPKLIAYYLPQFYPFKENDEWWGKGTTEWNNVGKAVPQFIGHYQPRLPGELGYYDLRLKENIERQVELAKLYGIHAFCYYFYYFDGKRLLDKPLDLFLQAKDIDFNFCLCWANEDWTKRFDGVSGEVIMKQSKTVESYKNFITSLKQYVDDKRYLKINGKNLLQIYKPSLIPDCKKVIDYWRSYCSKNGLSELYLIAVKEHNCNVDFLELGFDAVSEFNPGSNISDWKEITKNIDFACVDFRGHVFDYNDFVKNKRYFQSDNYKTYRAVVPMWDNTARRNNQGGIFHGSTPALYEKWLFDIIKETQGRQDLDDKLIFLNAWNEWGEGAYLEPDRKYGYAYLQASRNAIEKSRIPAEKS
jgi:lipopolysaccharide biosynthesis protein